MPTLLRGRGGFTILELLMVVAIIGILSTLLLAGMGKFRQKAEMVQCAANLRSLHVAASSYIQDYKHWPQIAVNPDTDSDIKQYTKEWQDALVPYGIQQKSWICPT